MKEEKQLPKISFQITDDKKRDIENFAKERGLTIAGFCRFVIFESIKQEGVKRND